MDTRLAGDNRTRREATRGGPWLLCDRRAMDSPPAATSAGPRRIQVKTTCGILLRIKLDPAFKFKAKRRGHRQLRAPDEAPAFIARQPTRFERVP